MEPNPVSVAVKLWMLRSEFRALADIQTWPSGILAVEARVATRPKDPERITVEFRLAGWYALQLGEDWRKGLCEALGVGYYNPERPAKGLKKRGSRKLGAFLAALDRCGGESVPLVDVAKRARITKKTALEYVKTLKAQGAIVYIEGSGGPSMIRSSNGNGMERPF